jgi:hypothetical protein
MYDTLLTNLRRGEKGCDGYYKELQSKYNSFKTKTALVQHIGGVSDRTGRTAAGKTATELVKLKRLEPVTFVLTSCGRPQLLEKTIDSFLKSNTYPIEKYVVIEDSGKKGINNNLKKKYAHLPFVWIDNEVNIGQVKSIDKAYALVDTPYIFHCQDDWEFYRPGFIEESMAILEEKENIVMVWIRELDDTNGHPVEDRWHKTESGLDYGLMIKGYKNGWHGFSLNPGLRRLKDYVPYQGITKHLDKGTHGSEVEINNYYFNKGFRAAILANGAVRHIGWGLSTLKHKRA